MVQFVGILVASTALVAIGSLAFYQRHLSKQEMTTALVVAGAGIGSVVLSVLF
jgi:hypothetical protein